MRKDSCLRKATCGVGFFVLMVSAVMQQIPGTVGGQEEATGSRSVFYGEPRVKPIPFEEMNAWQKELLGIVDGEPVPRRADTNFFKTVMHNPDLMARYVPLGDAVGRAPEIPDKHRELVIMRLEWLYQAEHPWGRHYGAALSAGWTHEDIERIKLGPDATGWNKFDRVLLKAADQLARNAYLDDEVWAALGEQYSVQDIMVLITVVTHYHWLAMMSNTLRIQLEDGSRGFQR